MTRRTNPQARRPRAPAPQPSAPQSARPHAAPEARVWTWLPPLLVIAAGVYAYHNSLYGPLVYDDLPAIQENPLIRTLWPLWNILSPPPASTLMQMVGRPTAILSLAINYAFGGLNVVGYHVLNVAVHIL